MSLRREQTIWCAALAWAALACGGGETEGSGGQRTSTCAVDTSVPCMCPTGGAGQKKCQLDGTYGLCDCSGSAVLAGRGATPGVAGAPALPITPVTPPAAPSGG